MTTPAVTTSAVTIPKAPGALPLIGHLRQLALDPTGFLTSLPAHGDLVEIRLGTKPTYVVCGPDLVNHVLVKDRHTYDKGGPFFDNIATFFGNGLATCPNTKHTRLRRLTQPAFHPGQMPVYADLTARELGAVLDTWEEGAVLDTYRTMQELATRITVSTMFSAWFTGPGAQDVAGQTLAHVDTLVAGAFVRMVAPIVARLPLPTNRRYERARSELYAQIDETIASYRREQPDSGDLLTMLLASDDDGQDMLSDVEVREQVMTMFIAGIGTTASMLGWTLYYLSRDAELDALVAAEVRAACGTGPVSHRHLGELPLLTAAVTETLRIRPAAWLYTRVTVEETELGGHRLPAGADVLISPYILNHRPDLFPEPERFDRTRWDDAGRAVVRGEQSGAFVPFGTGARKCIGQEFARMNIVLALAGILRDWRLAPVGDGTVGITGRSIIEPRGLKLTLVRRPPAGEPEEAAPADIAVLAEAAE